jgi:hypothetical protein
MRTITFSIHDFRQKEGEVLGAGQKHLTDYFSKVGKFDSSVLLDTFNHDFVTLKSGCNDKLFFTIFLQDLVYLVCHTFKNAKRANELSKKIIEANDFFPA